MWLQAKIAMPTMPVRIKSIGVWSFRNLKQGPIGCCCIKPKMAFWTSLWNGMRRKKRKGGLATSFLEVTWWRTQTVISRTQTNTLWTLCCPSRYGLPLIPTGVLVTIMGISVRRQTDLIRMRPIIKLFISPTCSPSCLDLTELYGKPWKQRCARLLVAMVIRFAIHFIFAKEAR